MIQLLAYISSRSRGESFVVFVDWHSGTGKTFLWNAILATLRSQDHIVLAVASCGVASLLLPGGRTAHSRLKISLDVHEGSQCGIGRGTNLAGLLSWTSLIIWDEAPMSHKHCFEALDRSLRDVLSVLWTTLLKLPSHLAVNQFCLGEISGRCYLLCKAPIVLRY